MAVNKSVNMNRWNGSTFKVIVYFDKIFSNVNSVNSVKWITTGRSVFGLLLCVRVVWSVFVWVDVWVCVFVWVDVCVGGCVCVVCVCVHVQICFWLTAVWVGVCVCLHVHVHICLWLTAVCGCGYVCICRCTFVPTAHAWQNIYIYIYIYIVLVLKVWRCLWTSIFHCLRLFHSPILKFLSLIAVYIPSFQVSFLQVSS